MSSPRRASPMSSERVRVLEPGRRRRRELELAAAVVLVLAAVGALTVLAGILALVVLAVRGLVA